MPIASKDWKEKKPLYRPVHSLVKGKKGSVYVIKEKEPVKLNKNHI